MSDAVEEEDSTQAHLASARTMVTKALEAAWGLQVRLGEGAGDRVHDSVLALVLERSPRAKFQMILDHPELLSHEAERLLDRTADLFRSLPDPELSHIRFFESHLDMIRLVRAGGVNLDAVPEKPFSAAVGNEASAGSENAQPLSASDHDDRARSFRDQGQVEEARSAFTEAIRLARVEGDAETEGRAEIGIFTLEMSTSHPRSGSRQRMLEHARRAVDAYRRAGDPSLERNAVVAMITVLTDVGDQPNLDSALQRLVRLDEDYGRWWREYSTAMNANDLDRQTSGLRWCVESAHLLADDADFYRKMCVGKLAFLENRPMPEDADKSDVFQAGVTAVEVMANGPTEAAADRLDAILLTVEQQRKYARSQTLQRELSGTHEVAYWTAMRCAEALRGPEAAVDINELASSRALLAQEGTSRLWRQWHPAVLEATRPEALRGLFARYTAAPTEPNRKLLTQAFGDQRGAQRDHERKLLSATPGLAMTAPPLATSSVRALLAENDRVVVYGATGSIFLVARDECRVIGRFVTRAISGAVRSVLAQLSDPVRSTLDDHEAVSWIHTNIIAPVLENTPEGCRLFLVPHRELWQIPLGVLPPVMLSDLRDVSYVPSLTLLARLLTKPRLRRSIERFVGFGDPDGSLPHARAEIGHAVSTFADSFTALGDHLEYHMVMANLADADVAHLACHGMFFPDYPDFSALHLAGRVDDPEVLWHSELARYELNARLVVLAACHAGTGETLFGSEYVGFPGVFLAAGARGVLAPLWAVSDQSTELLMRHFYTALQRFSTPAAALREAQRAMADDSATADPYHWAGFQLFGTAPDFNPFEAS